MALLRASAAARMILVLFAAEFFALLSRGTPWAGEWNWTIDWINGATILVGPLIAGMTAYDVWLWRQPDSRTLLVPTLRGQYYLIPPIVANAVVGVAVHVIGLLVALTATGFAHPGGTPQMVGVVPAFLAIAASSAVGALVAMVIPGLASAPASVIVVFAMSYFAASGKVPSLFRVGGTTGSLVGLTYDYSKLLCTSVALVGIVLVSALTVVRANQAVKSRVVTFSLVGAILLVAIPSIVLQSGDNNRFRTDEAQPNYDCAGANPRVCLAAQTSRQLDWRAEKIDAYVKSLNAVGVETPETFRQLLPDASLLPEDDGVVILSGDGVNAVRGSESDAARDVATPRLCEAYMGDKPPKPVVFDAQRAIQLWVLKQNDDIDPSALRVEPSFRWLQAPTSDQVPWLEKTYAALRSCALSAVTAPSLQ